MRALTALLCTALFPLTACGDLFGKGATDLYVVGCEETTEVVDPDETTSLGWSGADLVERVVGTWSDDFVWARDGSVEAMTLTVAEVATEVRFTDSTQILGEGWGHDPETYTGCMGWIEVDVPITFATASGAFDESLTSTLALAATDEVSLSAPLDPLAMTGTYDLGTDLPEEVEPADVVLWLAADFFTDRNDGIVFGYAEEPEGALFEVGAWGADE